MATSSIFPTYTPTWHSTSYPHIDPTLASLSAHDKTILITGGGTGTSAAIAKSFALAGASSIGLVGRREDPLITTAEAISALNGSTRVSYVIEDIISASSINIPFQTLSSQLGKVDILISNAGYLSSPLQPPLRNQMRKNGGRDLRSMPYVSPTPYVSYSRRK